MEEENTENTVSIFQNLLVDTPGTCITILMLIGILETTIVRSLGKLENSWRLYWGWIVPKKKIDWRKTQNVRFYLYLIHHFWVFCKVKTIRTSNHEKCILFSFNQLSLFWRKPLLIEIEMFLSIIDLINYRPI